MAKAPEQNGNEKSPTNLSLTRDTIDLGNQIAKATRRPSFTNVVEWLVWEEGIRQGLISTSPGKKHHAAFAQTSLLALVALAFVAAGFLWVFRSVELVMALVAWVSVIKYRFMQADANLHRRLSRREIIVICIGIAVLGFSTSVWAAVEVWGMLL